MRALGYLRRKPNLNDSQQEPVVEKPVEVSTPNSQTELSDEFEESVDLTWFLLIRFLTSASSNFSAEFNNLIPAYPQINEVAMASFFVSLNLSAIAGLMKVARKSPTIVVLIK